MIFLFQVETIGYIGRLLASLEAPDFTQGPYIMQSALILIAPAFLAASIYMILGRIIYLLNAESLSVIRPKWLTKIFVCGDVLSFLMQASGMKQPCLPLITECTTNTNKYPPGAGIMVAGSSGPATGERVIIGGLFVQIIFFGLFTLSAVVFQARLAKRPTPRSIELGDLWHRHMAALYVTSILILIRSIVRVVEYLEGYDGYLMKHEVFIYIFDALMMLIVTLVLQYIHPSEINCLLGRGDTYTEKLYRTRKFVPGSALEMHNSSEA